MAGTDLRPVRERRHDPDRKNRIIDAAIDVVADHGVAATTHRRIAAAADVPLGSLTYHFDSLQDLLRQAFEQHARRMSVTYAAHFEHVHTQDDLTAALADLIHEAGQQRDWAVAYELYLAALRDPALRSVTETWMRTSRSVLERFMDPPSARVIDALIEGLAMHRELSTAPTTRDQTRDHVRRALAGTTLKVPAP
jgi:DNA-binding transcriptional regulator YbjK